MSNQRDAPEFKEEAVRHGYSSGMAKWNNSSASILNAEILANAAS